LHGTHDAPAAALPHATAAGPPPLALRAALRLLLPALQSAGA